MTEPLATVSAAPPTVPIEAIRGEFPILENTTYLNSCSLGALSRRSEAYLQEFLERWHTMGASAWYEHWLGRIDLLRGKVARFLGAETRELALMPSTSAALSVIGESVDYSQRNRIVCTELDFPTLALSMDGETRGRGRRPGESGRDPCRSRAVRKRRRRAHGLRRHQPCVLHDGVRSGPGGYRGDRSRGRRPLPDRRIPGCRTGRPRPFCHRGRLLHGRTPQVALRRRGTSVPLRSRRPHQRARAPHHELVRRARPVSLRRPRVRAPRRRAPLRDGHPRPADGAHGARGTGGRRRGGDGRDRGAQPCAD